MIKKERLEELIEQSATIYRAYADVCVEEFKLNKDYKVSTAHLWKKMKHSAFKSCGYPLDQLFETKEDAEEYAEFGNITRTERLPYFPKYENIEYERGYFIRKFHIKDNYDGFGKLMVIKDFVILVQCSSLGVLHEEYFNKPATRENYNEARRLCVKLFKGEEV